MGTVILGPAAAAEAVCHDEQLQIWANDHIMAALSMGGYLREDLDYADVVEMQEVIMQEIKGIVQSAMNHPEARTIRRA